MWHQYQYLGACAFWFCPWFYRTFSTLSLSLKFYFLNLFDLLHIYPLKINASFSFKKHACYTREDLSSPNDKRMTPQQLNNVRLLQIKQERKKCIHLVQHSPVKENMQGIHERVSLGKSEENFKQLV